MRSGAQTAAAEARRGRNERIQPARAALARAVVRTVAYADVFDYALTADEIQRYLIGVAASRGMVRAFLQELPSDIVRSGRYYALAGREAAIDTRRERARNAKDFWPRAVHYGRRISNLPFVRMVAVTGGLAMDNMADGDIDYLIVTEPDRLWLCRALIVAVVRMAALRGTELCPNYFLSERALALTERNLFTAHEVAQMVPLAGLACYQQLRDLNGWTYAYLPNAGGPPRRMAAGDPTRHFTHALVESTLRSPVCSPLERWEMARKVRKLGTQGAGHAEAAFGPDWCKGHFGDHGQATLSRYAERVQALEE